MLPVGAQVFVPGSYSRAVLTAGKSDPTAAQQPPATRTWPLGSSVAVWPMRAVAMLPVTVHVPLAGSYSSALLSGQAVLVQPPATRTFPLGSKVAVCRVRAVVRLLVTVHVPAVVP